MHSFRAPLGLLMHIELAKRAAWPATTKAMLIVKKQRVSMQAMLTKLPIDHLAARCCTRQGDVELLGHAASCRLIKLLHTIVAVKHSACACACALAAVLQASLAKHPDRSTRKVAQPSNGACDHKPHAE